MENRYISYEIHEKDVRRWFIMCLILMVLWAATVAGWILSERKHYQDDFSYETMWILQNDEEPAEEFQAYG